MLITMKPDATSDQIEAVKERVRELGFRPHVVPGAQRTAVCITGNPGAIDPNLFALSGIAEVISVSKPYKLVSRETHPEDTVISFPGGRDVGGKAIQVMAGPCSVESREQILAAARAVSGAGATFLRGGAFKPRTSPYSFQGLKGEGLELLNEAREESGLLIVTEAKDTRTLAAVAEVTDIIQIGARNMQNYTLLEEVGRLDVPVLLKRGMSATIKELLMAAEYICNGGNRRVMLCERGIRTFEPWTRNCLDLGAVVLLKQLTHLPVIVDPSHGFGDRSGILPLSRAAVAAGADGLLVEVHPQPEKALSDGAQSLRPDAFEQMMSEIRPIARLLDRTVGA